MTGACHGDLVPVGGGLWRLYFAMRRNGRTASGKRHALTRPQIRSAVSRNGIDFRLDRRSPVRAAVADAHAMAAWHGRGLHLYVGDGSGDSSDGAERSHAVRHYISRRGDRFARLRPSKVPDVRFVGSIVSVGDGLRAYVSSDDGIVSLTSADGRDWRKEPGVRLDHGRDPAVVRLRDGSYLMLFVSAPDEHEDAVALVGVPDTSNEEWVEPIEPEDFPPETAVVPDEDIDAPEAGQTNALVVSETSGAVESQLSDAPGGAVDGSEQVPGQSTGTVIVNAETRLDESDGADVEGLPDAESGTPSEESPDAVYDESSDWRDDWDPEASDGYAPMPDFETKVDYIEWMRDYATEQPEENAYDAYASLAVDDSPLSELIDMVNGASAGPPGPWNPAEHPDWDASRKAVQDILEQFRKATKIRGYAVPVEFSEEDLADLPGHEPLLLGLHLSHLSRHRKLVRAALADAWRVGDDGKVSSERMLSAWRTALRGAAHLESGTTLIEDLVGRSERMLVQENARWALRRGTFAGADLETAFQTLRKFDRSEKSMSRSLRGEHAFVMDVVQYMFRPKKRGGPPQGDRQRIDAVVAGSFGGLAEADRMAAMTPRQIRETITALDAHYRELREQMAVGYPEVRAADVAATQDQYVHVSPVTEMFLASFARYYKLRAREETSRRATQLVFAVFAFQQQHGRWPASLDELAIPAGDAMRTDPFSGRDFVYRVTETGPIIYSVSENGEDDGGVHSPRWDDHVDEATGSDDFVFWPPQPN